MIKINDLYGLAEALLGHIPAPLSAIAFMDAELISGIETILRVARMEEELADADWVVTGEGRLDGQSLRGKVVSGIVALARKTHTHVAVFAGSMGLTEAERREAGIDVALALQKEEMSSEHAIAHAEELLYERSLTFADLLA